jgi:hypothetical protein
MMPGVYSPGQAAFNSNPGMSQLISMLSPSVLSNFAGPNTFIPHMTPTMSSADQIRMSGFQKQKFQSMYDVSQDNTSAVSDMFLGITKMASDTAANDPLTRERTSFAARIANDPAAKMIAGQFMGADNVEAMLHGSKGDISALNSKTAQMGYYMTDPSGVGRMGADAMSAYSRGVYSHLYEPEIDVKKETDAARSTDTAKRSQAKKRLKQAADTEDQILDDTEIVERLVSDANSSKKTAELYTKYVSGGKETDSRKQAEALVKYDRAIKESGVLSADEMSISQAGSAAEKRSVNNARGFLAGQVGQLTEYLQQTGQVGSSIGTKSLAERVSAVADLEVNDATYSRMGRDLAKKRFADTNNQSDEAVKYRSLATQAEREAFIRDNASPFEQEVRDTKQQAEKATKGGKGAPKLEDVEKLGGFQNLAVDVDADKTAKSIEGYLDAVAAVRDIFGDNGDPNAPMPALISTLNSLSGTAGAQMSSQKIATQIRQMQTAAKETGVSQRELIDMSLKAQTQAQSLGLTDADAMRGVTGGLLARKVMTENGEFNTPSYGEYNAQQSMELAQSLQQRGQASSTNKSLTAMVAMYESSPEAFKGTALEAAVKSYQNGSMEYVDPETGKTVNFAEEMATKGQTAVMELGNKAASTGVNKGRSAEEVERAKRVFERRYATEFNVTENQELTNDKSVMRVQSEASEDINERSLAVTVSNDLSELGTFDRLGINDETQQIAASKAISAKVEARAREAEKLPREEQAAYMQEHIEEDIRAGLEANGVSAGAAKKEAKRLATDREAYGKGSLRTGELFSQGRASMAANTGELRKNMRVIDKDVVEKRIEAADKSEARALTDDKLAQGFETTPMQRVSDYYRSLQTGNENFTASGFMEAIAPGREFSEVLRTIDKDMAVGFEQSEKRAKAAYIDEDEINKAVAGAKGGDQAALRKLAKVSDDTKVISEDEASQRLLTSLEGKTDDELFALSKEYTGNKFKREEVADNRDEIIRRVHADQRFYNKEVKGVIGDKETTVTQMHEAANKRRGEAADGVTEDEKKAILAREDAIQKSLVSGTDEAVQESIFQIEKLAEASMPRSTLQRATGRKPKFSKEQHKKLTELVQNKETKREDFEKFADDLGLTGDAREEVITAASGVAQSKELGGFAGSYGITKDAIDGEKKLTDVASDRKLPPPPDKKAEKEATGAAAEVKKLEDAGVINKDPTKSQEGDARHPHQKTAGQEEQVSVLKDILTAIRSLAGTDVKPELEKSDALKSDPTKAEANSSEEKAQQKSNKLAEAYIASAAGKTKEEAAADATKIGAAMPKVIEAIENAPTKADGTVDTKAVNAALKKAGVDVLPESISKGILADDKGAAVKKEDALAVATRLGKSLPVVAEAIQGATANDKGKVDVDSVTAAYKKAMPSEKKDKPGGVLSSLYDATFGADKPQVEVTTLGDLIKAPEKDVASAGRAVGAGREFNDHPISGLSAFFGGARGDTAPIPEPKRATPKNIDDAGYTVSQQLPNPQTAVSSYQTAKDDRVVNPKPEAATQQKQKMEIVGRLTLDGLQEVILAAAGETAVQTNGAPVVPG